MRVLALVAAAGRSGRMGSAKALLPFGDHDDAVSFVAHVVAVCRVAGCDDGEILEVNQVCAYFWPTNSGSGWR